MTDWARQGVNVDIAMKASEHTSVQMHTRYLDLQREDVAKAFGLLQDGNTDKGKEKVDSQVADFYGRRRKVPGGAAGLQNQSGGRKVPGGFDSLPSPPKPKSQHKLTHNRFPSLFDS